MPPPRTDILLTSGTRFSAAHQTGDNLLKISDTEPITTLYASCSNAQRIEIGFTLIELLAAMGIMAVLMTLVAPAASTILRGSQLTQAGQQIESQLGLARQTALSKNHPTEVRFYQYAVPEIPGAQANAPDSGNFQSMQSFEMLESGVKIAIGKIQRLPSSILIDRGNVLSSIIGNATSATSYPSLVRGVDLGLAVPPVGTNYNAVSFHFFPDGSTDLPATNALWFITLHSMVQGDNLTEPPKNYFTIQINAFNAHIKIFRP